MVYRVIDTLTGDYVGTDQMDLIFETDYDAQTWIEKSYSDLELRLDDGSKPNWTESDDARR